MKKLIIALSLVLSQASFAAISNSSLEVRHASLVESAIADNCGSFMKLVEVNSKKEIIKVDQGITDAKFVTNLEGVQKFDQFFDKYVITVESEYYDSYDHDVKDWGIYRVSSVKCTFVNN